MITNTAKDIFLYMVRSFGTAIGEGIPPLFKGIGAFLGLLTIPLWYLPVWIWAKIDEPKYIKRVEEEKRKVVDRYFSFTQKTTTKE